MGNPMPSFRPLARPNQTRLLHLCSATGPNDLLLGWLEHIDLDDEHIYEALSYEWGSLQKTHKFTLNDGSSISITKSLHQALQDIRYELPSQGDRIIWADAICINQDDIAEREQQVSLMGSIYRKAKGVITYIGPESHDSAVGIQFANYLFKYVSSLSGPEHAWPAEEDPRWEAVRSLILRSWASRSWCAQEYLLNANVTLRCGRTDFADEFLIADVTQLAVDRCIPVFCLPESQDDPKAMRECHRILGALRLETAQKATTPLSILLQLCHPLQATDPRDKVYSLLGLTKISWKVDYACSVEDLYVQVAKSILTETPTLDILYDNLTCKKFNLPSWVPDWSTWLFGSHGMAVSEGYSAGGSTETCLELHNTKNALEVKGSLIDRISWLSDRIGPYYERRYQMENTKLKAWLTKLQNTMQGQALRHGGLSNTLDDILWRSLTGDITFDEEPASAIYKSFFYAHMNCTENSSESTKNMGREFYDAVRRRSRYRKLCATNQGFFGAVPETADIGDWICIFNGGKHIFVIKECEKGFKYVGYAYVDGLMKGEGLELGHEARGLLLV